MNPEYMFPDLWVHQLLSDNQKRERVTAVVADEAALEVPRTMSWWKRASALFALRGLPSSPRLSRGQTS